MEELLGPEHHVGPGVLAKLIKVLQGERRALLAPKRLEFAGLGLGECFQEGRDDCHGSVDERGAAQSRPIKSLMVGRMSTKSRCAAARIPALA